MPMNYINLSGNPFHRETDFFIYTAKPKFDLEGRDAMYFTHGDHRAFESLMRGRRPLRQRQGRAIPGVPELPLAQTVPERSVLQVRRVSLRSRPHDRQRKGQSAGERR